MGLFIFLALLVIAGLILAIRCKSLYSDVDILGEVVAIMSVIVLVGVLCYSMTLPSKFSYEKAYYHNLKEQLEYVEHDDILTGENLRNQVLEMNCTISKHKCYSRNFFIGVFFSEEIGNLEPLRYTKH